MDILTTNEARSKLYKIVDQVAESHKPVYIKGLRNEAVILSKEDFDSITETLAIASVPGLRDSIKEGMQEDIKDCSDKLDW